MAGEIGERVFAPASEVALLRQNSGDWVDIDHVAALGDYEGSFVEPLTTLLLAAGKSVAVPAEFPAWLCDRFVRCGIEVLIDEFTFLRTLLINEDEDLDSIRAVARVLAAVFDEVRDDLAAATRRGDRLMLSGEAITSVSLRRRIAGRLGAVDVRAESVTIGCGPAGALGNPTHDHHLEANQPIVIDVVARSLATGFVADMARTWAVGQPSEPVLELYETVWVTKNQVETRIGPGTSVAKLHAATMELLARRGVVDVTTGPFPDDPDIAVIHHSIGHAIGLDLHQPPIAGPRAKVPLEPGMVFAFEPAAYVSNLGGIRLEDMLEITSNGSVSMTGTPSRRWTI